MKWVSDKVSEAWGGEKCESWHLQEPNRTDKMKKKQKPLTDKNGERQSQWKTALTNCCARKRERENWDELRGERRERICGRRGRRLLGTAQSKKPLQKGEQQTVMTRWLLLLLMKLLTKFHFFLFFFIVLLCTCHLISTLSLSPLIIISSCWCKQTKNTAGTCSISACRSLHCGNEAGTTTTSVSVWQW